MTFNSRTNVPLQIMLIYLSYSFYLRHNFTLQVPVLLNIGALGCFLLSCLTLCMSCTQWICILFGFPSFWTWTYVLILLGIFSNVNYLPRNAWYILKLLFWLWYYNIVCLLGNWLNTCALRFLSRLSIFVFISSFFLSNSPFTLFNLSISDWKMYFF